ncbi:MAG: hypothetical protein LBV44_08465 [Methylobacillus sp.]|jgi:hypothetical protein|nr:hypothetical protein [Methylobacillus sp.]
MSDTITPEEVTLLRAEIEMLMKERQELLLVVGASAELITELHTTDLPRTTVAAAELIASCINGLPEETLKDALVAVRAGG